MYAHTDERYDEYFGFTDTEVREMLKYYETEDHYEEIKDYVNVFPENYWINTSSNDAVKKFIQMSDNLKTKREIETLLAGGEIIKEIHQELIYPEMYQSLENVWSLLFMTGYLTQRGKEPDGRYHLAIPNREICDCMVRRVLALFKRSVSQNRELLRSFCNAMLASDASTMEHALTEYMGKTISIRDSFAKSIRENFYHGLLIGILGSQGAWKATSNKESGDGFSDILIEVNEDDLRIGMVLELKYSKTENALDKECDDALQQIEDKNYDQELREKGYTKILKYGIAFYHKKCRVKTSFVPTS